MKHFAALMLFSSVVAVFATLSLGSPSTYADGSLLSGAEMQDILGKNEKCGCGATSTEVDQDCADVLVSQLTCTAPDSDPETDPECNDFFWVATTNTHSDCEDTIGGATKRCHFKGTVLCLESWEVESSVPVNNYKCNTTRTACSMPHNGKECIVCIKGENRMEGHEMEVRVNDDVCEEPS